HVPYKGGAPAMTDLIGGQVDATFMNINTGLPQIKAGKLRALAITSTKRSPLLPDVPTMEELGYKGVTVYSSQAISEPNGVPADAAFPCGLKLAERVPQGHKVALMDFAAGDPVLRYDVVIARAAKAIAAGSWVHERLLEMPAARSLDGLPISTVKREPLPVLE